MEGSRLSAFSVTPLTFDHAPLLHKWLQEPHVMKFWDDGDRSLEDVRNHYSSRFFPKVDAILGAPSDVKSWIASFNETPFAYLQIYFVTEHHELSFWLSKKYTTIVLDFFIGEPSFLEKGLAIPLLECFIDQILKDYLPFRLLVDPNVNNAKAVRIYDKMGFEALGEFQNDGKSYRVLKKDCSSRSVQIVPYDPKWPKMFEEEASRIKEVLDPSGLCGSQREFGRAVQRTQWHGLLLCKNRVYRRRARKSSPRASSVKRLDVENIGSTTLRFLEIFRDRHFADISLAQWLAFTPKELVEGHLHIDPSILKSVSKRKSPIVP